MQRFALVLTGIALLLFGAEGLYRALRERQPKTISCERFLRERPENAWLRLGNCEIDYIGAGYRESRGRIVELFFPVRAVGQPRQAPVAIVVATKDPTAIATAQQTIGDGRTPDQEQFLVMMLKIVTNLRASREIHGYARNSFLEKMQAKRLVSGLAVPVDPQVILVDLYRRPAITLPAIAAGAGALGILAVLFLRLRERRTRRRAAAAAAPVSFEPSPMPFEPVPAPRPVPQAAPPLSLRGLMLLNLPPTADAAMIENAPPLGMRALVVQKLRAAMPGVQPDARGRCVFARPDCSVVVDLGPDEPITTAVIDAEGDGAASVVRGILEASGWRLYAVRAGEFLDPDRLERA